MQYNNFHASNNMERNFYMLQGLSSMSQYQNTMPPLSKVTEKRSAAQMEDNVTVDLVNEALDDNDVIVLKDKNVKLEEWQGYGINCFLCQKLFTDMDELQYHYLIHSTERHENITTKLYNCDVCGRSLRSEQELHDHHKRFHAAHVIRKEEEEARRRFKCDQCSDVYASQDFLNSHIRLAHNKPVQTPLVLSECYSISSKFLGPLPKRKYPPRSPFFNPNFLLDCDAYICVD